MCIRDSDEGGAVIVMDYATGAVESVVSYPSFDNNLFNFPLDPAVWDYYSNEDSGNPLLNRATQSTFMPGSAFKPFSSVPAINAGVLNADSVPPIKKTPPHSEGNETGSYSWTPDIEGGHSGAIYSKDVAKSPGTYEMAMKSSDNIYFAYYALQTTLEPVSYTHLDVYKRQAYHDSLIQSLPCLQGNGCCIDLDGTYALPPP